MDDNLNEQSDALPGPNSAPIAKRIIAFLMDAALIFILIQLAALIVPKMYDASSVKEFNEFSYRASLLANQKGFDSLKIDSFLNESKLSVQTYKMIFNIAFLACIIPVLYFFCGEAFFKGQTLGKATFGLRTVPVNHVESMPIWKVLIRSTLKGFATLTLFTPFFLPGILNFCTCLLNHKKRCVHEILSGTMTTQPK